MKIKESEIYLDENPLSYKSKSYTAIIKFYSSNMILNNDYMIIKFNENIKLSKVKKLAWSNLSKNCFCDYDCCGHWVTIAMEVKRVAKNKFSIRQYYARNY